MTPYPTYYPSPFPARSLPSCAKRTTPPPSPLTANSKLLTPNLFYTFSAKEKDSETGLSYFGSRYYYSDLSIWLSVDPQAAKYASLSPYNYCANNPVKLVDPNGEEIGEYYDWNGKYLGSDGLDNEDIYFVSDNKSIRHIRMNERGKKHTSKNEVKIDWETNKSEISEIIDVYNRAVKNGGDKEEATTFSKKGGSPKRYPTSEEQGATYIDEQGYMSIHSHRLDVFQDEQGQICYQSPFVPSETHDKAAFLKYQFNVIVGDDYDEYRNNYTGTISVSRTPMAVIYDSKTKEIGNVPISQLNRIVR